MSYKVCVTIPAYNASNTVGEVVKGVLAHIPKVIVADDGSTDNTGSVAHEAGSEVIRIEKNKGKGDALKVLFWRAFEEGYDAVITMDADGQHDPQDIERFITAHAMYPESIIVGSRMHEKEKIPRARYNSMHIARFYISLAANQFVEDTQCGFRLYPVSLLKKMLLMTGKYVTETEILMKAGDMGVRIRFVKIRTIYNGIGSHFRPIADVTHIAAYVISYLYIKWFIEGFTSDAPNTYSGRGYLRDLVNKNRTCDVFFQALTAFTALPASVFFLLEYLFLPPVIGNNFASVRRLRCGFAKITLATHMLPVTLIVAIIEKLCTKPGLELELVDKFIRKFYPYLWPKGDTEHHAM